jgi:hypothetical protein
VLLIHSDSNPKFNIYTVFIANYFFSNISIDNKIFLVIDFMNLKIKSVQSFKDSYISRLYLRMLIDVSSNICMNIFICNMI